MDVEIESCENCKWFDCVLFGDVLVKCTNPQLDWTEKKFLACGWLSAFWEAKDESKKI